MKKNKGESKMNKKEFDMGNEKITEYTSTGRDAKIMPVEDTQSVYNDIPAIHAHSYIETQDTTLGFYSDEELAKSEIIYNYSDRAKTFVSGIKIFRWQRHYLIRAIAAIFHSNDCYGLTMVLRTVIEREADKICSEYKINKDTYNIFTKAILLNLCDEHNHIDYSHYLTLTSNPDSLFYDWDEYIDKEEYKFYDIRKYDENFDSFGYKVRRIKFKFEDNTHIQIGISMGIDLYHDSASAKNIDFSFYTSGISAIIDSLDKINTIKGSY